MSNYTDWYTIADPDYPFAVPDSCCDGPICGLQGAKVAFDEVNFPLLQILTLFFYTDKPLTAV